MIQPAGARKGPSTGTVVRWILALILLALVIAVVVALVSLAGSAGEGVDANDAVEQEVNEQITRLQDFIDEHTAPE